MARFKVGDWVIHRSRNRLGRVVEVFHDGEQPRYYVAYSWEVWSVPEDGLLFSEPKNQQLTKTENA